MDAVSTISLKGVKCFKTSQYDFYYFPGFVLLAPCWFGIVGFANYHKRNLLHRLLNDGIP
jgi:hypothetical protein